MAIALLPDSRLRPKAVGLSRIRVTSWLGGIFLSELQLEVSVESGTALADSQRRGASLGPLQADPGEEPIANADTSCGQDL